MIHPVVTESQRMLLGAFKRPRYRTMAEWAEQEIILPSGEFEGRKYSFHRQPYARLWFDEVDSGHWNEFVLTGPSQSGKSLNGFVIPICYHLFERAEAVIAAVPAENLVKEKWERDLEPVISRTRYRDLVPTKGPGSRGGRTGAMQFANGARLIWMTAGGDDKSRASVTARVVCITETDGFDVRASTSEESNKIEQLEARTRSYALSRRRIFKECTLSTKRGHTWIRYCAGSKSEIYLPCPHCGQHVKLERENFANWQEADTERAAALAGSFFCNACGECWTEEQRIAANRSPILLHKRQKIQGGRVVGDRPETMTLGFRWSAVNNCLIPAADVAVDEFKAHDAADEDDAERKLCQFVWSDPYEPEHDVSVNLEPEDVVERLSTSGRGQIPDNAQWLTLGVDFGERVMHWTAIAWLRDHTGQIIDYGTIKVPIRQYARPQALEIAFTELSKAIGVGWTGDAWLADRGSKHRWYDLIFVDVSYWPDDLINCLKDTGLYRLGWKPYEGLGRGQFDPKKYTDPKRISAGGAIAAGQGWYQNYDPVRKAMIIKGDANAWKTWLHGALKVDSDASAISLFASSNESEHKTFARHLTAEQSVIRYEHGKGYVKVWESLRAANHWLDSTYMAAVAGCKCGFRLKEARKKKSLGSSSKIARTSSRGRSGAATFRNRPQRMSR